MIELPALSSYDWWVYVLFTGLGSVIVRLINSIWRNLESHEPSWKKFWGAFIGLGWKVPEKNIDDSTCQNGAKQTTAAADYLQAFFLGWLELICYPVLLFSDKASYIAAWLAFKTVHRWNYAPEIDRGFYNRYLLSNALILVGAYALAKLMLYV